MNKVNTANKLGSLIRLLLVDDNPGLLEVTKSLIEGFGYIVTPTNTGSEALILIKEYHNVFDVVVTDLAMPGMDGVEFAILASKILVDTPIILYTGKVDVIDTKKIAEAGITAIAKKPCRIKDLDTIITKTLSIEREACS